MSINVYPSYGATVQEEREERAFARINRAELH